MFVQRNYSYTEKEDYLLHVKPFVVGKGNGRRGGRVEGIYIMRNPAPTLTGWNIIEMGPGMINDSSYPDSNTGLDPSRGNHGA